MHHKKWVTHGAASKALVEKKLLWILTKIYQLYDDKQPMISSAGFAGK